MLQANKADCFISLPGFTTSPAEEVKSRKFAFKVYHTGEVHKMQRTVQPEKEFNWCYRAILMFLKVVFIACSVFLTTGTVFYFAAESDEELAAWLDCLSMATFALDVPTLKTSASEGNLYCFPWASNIPE